MNPRYVVAAVVAIFAIAGIGYFAFVYETEPPRCGNGVCEPEYGETWESCPEDCDKPAVEHCGNGECEPELGENCMTCPEDCGECPPEPEGLGFRLPYSQVHTGDVFWVTVYCDYTSEAIGGWKFTIGYDSSVLEAKHVVIDDDIWLGDEGAINDGSIANVQAWTTKSDLNTKMDLVQIKFEAVSSGTATLEFEEFKISNAAADRIYPTANTADLAVAE